MATAARKKLKRKAQPVGVKKAVVTSPDLDNGGKLNPQQGIGESGILPPRKKPKFRVVEEEGTMIDHVVDERKLWAGVPLVKQIKLNPKNMFFFVRLPENVRKKLTGLSRVIVADHKGAEVEVVDHITMLFVKDAGCSEDQAAKACKAIKDNMSIRPVKAKLQGWGYFDGAQQDGEKKTALVALVDAPGLVEIHVDLKTIVSGFGIPASKQIHGYVPHATVAYLPLGTRVKDLPVLDVDFSIDKVELAHTKLHEVKLKKELKLSPDTDPIELSLSELQAAHWKLHMLFRAKARGKAPGWSTEDISNLHALVVDELFEQDVKHPAPPDDGLDDVSEDFEQFEDKQPDWHVPPKVKPDSKKVKKRADPEVPSEDRKYPFTLQRHYVGKSVCTDLRIGFRPDKLTVGWALKTQADVQDPVVTLAQAKVLDEKMDGIIGPKSGRTTIVAKRKSPGPWPWLNVEGKTKQPEEGKAPPVGGTREFPGVFHQVERGQAEFGVQKSDFHEYWLEGTRNQCRIVIKYLNLEVDKSHSRSQCMHCKRAKPVVDVLWADGRGRAWFCKVCFPKWKKEVGSWACIVGQKEVTTGEVPEKWADVHKRIDLDDDPVTTKAILPPDQPGTGTWLATRPDDLTPHVLSGADGMPPAGVSALPQAIRKQVPVKFRYWKEAGDEALATRQALLDAMKAGDVKLDFEAPFKTVTKASSRTKGPFVLQAIVQEQDSDEEEAVYFVRMDVGLPNLVTIRLFRNPMEVAQMTVEVEAGHHKEAMEAEGRIKPGHFLNPNKGAMSTIRIMDRGTASILSMNSNVIEVKLKGAEFKGTFMVTRRDDLWLWEKVNRKEADMYKAEVNVDVPILKVVEEKRQVTGVVLEPDEVDAQGDTIKADVIEKAAFNFLRKFNRETELGAMHTKFGDVGLELCESWITKVAQKIGGQAVKTGTWMITVKVLSDDLWNKVKSGEITGFSIGGVATVA